MAAYLFIYLFVHYSVLSPHVGASCLRACLVVLAGLLGSALRACLHGLARLLACSLARWPCLRGMLALLACFRSPHVGEAYSTWHTPHGLLAFMLPALHIPHTLLFVVPIAHKRACRTYCTPVAHMTHVCTWLFHFWMSFARTCCTC